MAAPPAKDELETLEQARARLEAALAGDELWRALHQPASDSAAAKPAARRARIARLERALAGNELYKAWKHLSQAIDALRARLPEGGPAVAQIAAKAEAKPQPETSAGPGRPRRRRLQSELAARVPTETPQVLLQPGESLMDRLADVAPATPGAASAPVAPQGAAAAAGGPVANEAYNALSHVSDPPEATVAFVVRETPRLKQAEPPRGNGAQGADGSFRRGPGVAEAEVDIRAGVAPAHRADAAEATAEDSKPRPAA